MRLSIAITLTDGKCYLPLSADRDSVEYAGPLATFIAQLAVSFLWVEIRAPERCRHHKATVSYQTSPQRGARILDRSA